MIDNGNVERRFAQIIKCLCFLTRYACIMSQQKKLTQKVKSLDNAHMQSWCPRSCKRNCERLEKNKINRLFCLRNFTKNLSARLLRKNWHPFLRSCLKTGGKRPDFHINNSLLVLLFLFLLILLKYRWDRND